MDPLTSRITRILVDKGTFYALIPLFLTLPLSIIINYVSLFVNCVEVVRCVPTNWCNKRQPPQSHYEMPPRDYVLGGNPRRAAANCRCGRVCGLGSPLLRRCSRLRSASVFQLLLPHLILVPQLDAVCWPEIMWYGIRHVGNVLCVKALKGASSPFVQT